MYLSLDVVLVAQFTTSTQVGAYKAARVIADVAMRPFYAMAAAVQVEFSKHWYAGDRANVRRMAVRFTGVAFVLASAGCGVLAAIHPAIVDAAFGEGYGAAQAPLLMMILGTFIWTATAPLHVLPAAVGRAWPHASASPGGGGRADGGHMLARAPFRRRWRRNCLHWTRVRASGRPPAVRRADAL